MPDPVSFTKGSQMRGPLLNSIVEHARLFAQENPKMKPDAVHEALLSAVARGLVDYDMARTYKPEVRVGERIDDDPIRRTDTDKAADRVLDKLRVRGVLRTDFD